MINNLNIRVNDKLREALEVKAIERKTTISDLVRNAIVENIDSYELTRNETADEFLGILISLSTSHKLEDNLSTVKQLFKDIYDKAYNRAKK